MMKYKCMHGKKNVFYYFCVIPSGLKHMAALADYENDACELNLLQVKASILNLCGGKRKTNAHWEVTSQLEKFVWGGGGGLEEK